MRKAQYLLGLFYILLVNFLWVSSGFLVQSIFEDKHFNSPFLVTYYSTTLFAVYLLFFIPFLCKHCRDVCTRKLRYSRLNIKATSDETEGNEVWCAASFSQGNNSGLQVEEDCLEREITDSEKVLENHLIEKLPQSPSSKKSTQLAKESDGVVCCFCCVVEQSTIKLSLVETLKLSGTFCFIWFGMSYFYNASLLYTSLSSNTVLSTLSGPFCLILSTVVLKEPLVWSNIAGVIVVVAGASLISTQDEGSDDDGAASNHILGDAMAIFSAFIYGCYTTLMKYWVKDDNSISMFLFFGLVGGCNIICLWPLFFFFNYTGIEPIQIPEWDTVGLLTLTGAINVISDYFWARSILLTSPLIASVGLCLTIPLALVADLLFRHKHQSSLYILGATCVAVGFILVNLKASQSLEEETDLQRSLSTEEDN